MYTLGKGVYIMQAGVFFKIGATENLTERVGQLQTGCPIDINVVLFLKVDDNYKIENYLHTQFSSKRIRGEWFLLSSFDVEVIQENFEVELLQPLAYVKIIDDISNRISGNVLKTYQDPFKVILDLFGLVVEIEPHRKTVKQCTGELIDLCDGQEGSINYSINRLTTEKEKIKYYEQSTDNKKFKKERWEKDYKELFSDGMF